MTTAQPDVGLPEPRVIPWVLALARLVSWPYLRLGLGFERVTVSHGDILVDAFKDAMDGRRRVILAFRHPYGDEPQLLSWLFAGGISREARRLGVRMARKPHAVFVHGYEVPRWGGALVRWILPRVGAMPVHHSKLDSSGMARILAAIEDGTYPVALSPEGQVSYTSDGVPRLEPGVVRLGFQAANRLASAGRAEHVHILPVSVHYHYSDRARSGLARLVARLERFVGLPCAARVPAGTPGGTGARLGDVLEVILTNAERQYGLSPNPGGKTATRVEAVVEAALSAGERILGIARTGGDRFAKLYRIRQIGWDRVYLPSDEDPRGMSPMARAVADRRAGEAWYGMRHMELADFALYLRSGPPADDAPLRVLVEYAQNLWDFANRLAGGTISDRVEVRPKQAVIIVGQALDLCDRLAAFRADRKKATVDALMELEESYQHCIKENIDEN
jgi:hypothetical protein